MRNQVDSEDAILAPLFTLAAAASVGIADVTLFSASIQDTAFSLGGTAISIAAVVAPLVLAVAFVTNDPDLSRLDDEYYYAAIATAGLVVAMPLIPAAQDFATGNDFVALIVVTVETAGFMAISYLA
jgi:hypothetical protein